jgi:hypothetical protein
MTRSTKKRSEIQDTSMSIVPVRRSLRIAIQKCTRKNSTAEEKQSAIQELKQIYKNALLKEWNDVTAVLDKLKMVMQQNAGDNPHKMAVSMYLYDDLCDAFWKYRAFAQCTINVMNEKMLIVDIPYTKVMFNLGCHINVFVKSLKYYTNMFCNAYEIYTRLCMNLTKEIHKRMQ